MGTARLISVVDDDESLRNSLANLIRSLGFRAQAFPSAEAFLAAGESRDTACVVLDVRMPGMSGFELQRHLADARWRVPVIFLTAHAEDGGARSRALEAGAVAFLYKPCREEDVIRALHAALSPRELT
jgi:FixJ family two-component response regulator